MSAFIKYCVPIIPHSPRLRRRQGLKGKKINTNDLIRSTIYMLAVDGEISGEEKTFLKNACKRFGVDRKVVNNAIKQLNQGTLKIKASSDPLERVRIFDMLLQAAVADGEIDPKERKILDRMAEKADISQQEMERSIQQKLTAAVEAGPHDSAPEEKMNCPKCGFEQKEGMAECFRCGVIFAKFSAIDDAAFESVQAAERMASAESSEKIEKTVNAGVQFKLGEKIDCSSAEIFIFIILFLFRVRRDDYKIYQSISRRESPSL